MLNLLVSLLVLLGGISATMSPESKKLELLRVTAESQQSRPAELAYLKAFPRTYARFHFIFYGGGKPSDCCSELYYQAEEHLNLLKKLSAKYPRTVLGIQLDVAVNGRWDADAVGKLQHQLIDYAAAHTREFAEALSAYPHGQRLTIIAFLADMESIVDYAPYQGIIDALQKQNFRTLAADFIRSREERQKWHHD